MPTQAFDLLANPPKRDALPGVVVLFGDDTTLRSWALAAVTQDGDADTFEGDESTWRDIRDEASTVSLFDTGRRTVVVRRADGLVKKHRSDIEDYLAKPSSAGRLIIDLQSCAANTKLYKLADKNHLLIHCGIPRSGRSRNPDTPKLRGFLTSYVAARHQCKLNASAADLLIDLVGSDVGMLETEIAKLALYLKPGGKIDEALVQDVVGGWKAATTWQTIDAAAHGDAAEALRQLDKMMASGEQPIALLPQFAWAMRRFGLATAAIEHAEATGRRITLAAALKSAGFRDYDLKKVEQQLRQLGRERSRQLLRWLLDADLKLKSTHSQPGPDRWVLEELVLKLAKT